MLCVAGPRVGPEKVGRVCKAWRRPTLPRLEAQYHRRRGFSRPSSGWDRVFGPSLWPPGPVRRTDYTGRRTDLGRRLIPRPSSDGKRVVWVSSEQEACRPGFWRNRGCACRRGGTRVPPEMNPCRWAWAREADRAISTGQLRGLPRFHLRPIDVMVSHGSRTRPGFEEGFPLRCFQRLSRPHLATRRCGWRHNRYTRGASLPVLSY